jgi:hypothetical protein
MIFSKEKRCSKCGLAFDCGGLFGCWCRDVKLTESQLAGLRQRYADCLCPTCLAAIAAGAEIPPPVSDDEVTRH